MADALVQRRLGTVVVDALAEAERFLEDRESRRIVRGVEFDDPFEDQRVASWSPGTSRYLGLRIEVDASAG